MEEKLEKPMLQEKLNNFEKYLKNNTSLLNSTIRLYGRTVRTFFSEFDILSVENMNNFITVRFREKNCPYTKYALIRFLKYIGQKEMCFDIVKVKTQPNKKVRKYLPAADLEKIVDGVKSREYKIVALIQFVTGARAKEVLRIRKDHVFKEPDGMNINTILKGNREVLFFIPKKHAGVILAFINNSTKEYPFLRGKNKELDRLIDNNYRYYWNAIKQSGRALGFLEFATHDFRACFATDSWEANKGDLAATKEAMHHKRIDTTEKYINRLAVRHDVKKTIKRIRG